jgi:hypothetical protein
VGKWAAGHLIGAVGTAIEAHAATAAGSAAAGLHTGSMAAGLHAGSMASALHSGASTALPGAISSHGSAAAAGFATHAGTAHASVETAAFAHAAGAHVTDLAAAPHATDLAAILAHGTGAHAADGALRTHGALANALHTARPDALAIGAKGTTLERILSSTLLPSSGHILTLAGATAALSPVYVAPLPLHAATLGTVSASTTPANSVPGPGPSGGHHRKLSLSDVNKARKLERAFAKGYRLERDRLLEREEVQRLDFDSIEDWFSEHATTLEPLPFSATGSFQIGSARAPFTFEPQGPSGNAPKGETEVLQGFFDPERGKVTVARVVQAKLLDDNVAALHRDGGVAVYCALAV